jgi:hypothetical protein
VISFEQARTIADDTLRPSWSGAGTFFVAPYGWQDEETFLVVVGAREAIEGGDPAFARSDAPAVFVKRETGEVRLLVQTPILWPRIDAMTPIGDHPEA